MHYCLMDPPSKRLPEQSSHMVFHTGCMDAGFPKNKKKYAELLLSSLELYKNYMVILS